MSAERALCPAIGRAANRFGLCCTTTNLLQDYVSTNHVLRGASDQSGACREAQAATAFLWFGWATFVATLVMSAMGFKSGGGSSGGIRRGPAMAQV